jgi:hypothetical protein
MCLMAVALLGSVSPGCGNGDGGGGARTSTNAFCRRWASLSEARGCAAPTGDCTPLPECASAYGDWLDCLEADLEGGCICESTDGDMNCEGSWKPNEGTARCVAEVEAMNACDAR